MIDGFPRAIDQAIYFEKNVTEVDKILFYDVPQEIMLQRCMKRAETSGRSDDNAETIKKRVQNYFDQSLPVIDYYKMFGKVHHIHALKSIEEVYSETKRALIPQVVCVLGPKSSGKTTVSSLMAQRTNMRHVDFNHFVKASGLVGQDDEAKTAAFLEHISKDTKPRIVVENFPQTLTQAKYFMRNGTVPSHIFTLKCAKDICQERMIELGQEHPNYVSSALLSKMVKRYNDSMAEIIPFLQKETNFIEVRTD